MEFWVNLIRVRERDDKGQEFLKNNCIQITEEHFFFEGFDEILEDVFSNYSILYTGVVESLGGKTQKELIKIALESFDMPLDDRRVFESILEEHN